MVVEALPKASHLVADRGYDSAWFRQALTDKGIQPFKPTPKNALPIRRGHLPPAPQGFSSGIRRRLRDADPSFRRTWLQLFVSRTQSART